MNAAVQRPRILVTNDDGIESPGLATLARCAVEAGWETVVAAPAGEASGTSAALTAATTGNRIEMRERELPGLGAVECYALAANPALITLIAFRGGLGARPAIVLSGVNRGSNIGRAVLHSGTVGAALTGGINGARAMAVSLDSDWDDEREVHWDNAAAVVSRLLPVLAGMDQGAIVNVNVPNVAPGRSRGLRWARLATYGRVQSRVQRMDDGALELVTIIEEGELESGTDAALLAEGYTTITPLRSVSEHTELMGADLPG